MTTQHYNTFEQAAKDVWAAPTIEAKRQLMDGIIDSFKFKAKQDQFRRKVASAKNAYALDKLAGDLVLLETGDKVIK